MSRTSGDWRMFRHDPDLSGHQPLPGRIDRPTVAWRTRLGGPVFDGRVFEIDGELVLIVPFGGCIQAYSLDGEMVWRTRPHGIEGIIGVVDVDCDGNMEVVASNGRSIFVYRAQNGSLLSEVWLGPPLGGGFLFTSVLLHHFQHVGPGYQLAVGMLSSREVVLLDFSSGAVRPERRHLLWMDDFFHPTVLAADIDGDGEEELIVTKLSSVFVFDPSSGRLKSECNWSSGGMPRRNYGLFQIRDIDGDGRLDMLIMSYVVSRHIAVVENDGSGRLRNRWDRFIEHIYPRDECELRYTVNSCCDVDHDGKCEIVASIYNERRDGRWWLEIMDAWNGGVRLSVPDLYLHDVVQFANGVVLVLASRETSRVPSELSQLCLFTWGGGQMQELWSASEFGLYGRYVSATPDYAIFKEDLPPSNAVWTVGNSVVLRGPEDSIWLLMESVEGEWSVEEIPCSSGSIALLDVVETDEVRIWITSSEAGQVRLITDDGAEFSSIECGVRYRYGSTLYFTPRPASTPIVIERHLERFIAVPDSAWNIHMFEWDPRDSAPGYLWSRAGRGSMGPEEMYHSLTAIENQGETMLLMARVGDGDAELVAVDLEGMERGVWPATSIPASPRIARGRTGIYCVHPVETEEGPLIFLSGYRSGSMNSELSLVVDPRQDATVWEQITVNDRTEDGRGFGPWNGVSRHGDGRIVFMAKDTFCEVDARSGELMRKGWQLRPYNTAHLRRRGMSMDDFSAYGSPATIALDNTGNQAWLLHGNYGGAGVINFDHSVRWWLSAPLSTLTSSHFGVADIDNDGITEIGISYCDGDFVCFRADTGEEKWRLHDVGVASDVVTCDIDSDGQTEFILATREGELLCLASSTSGCGLVKWRLTFDYSLGPPIVADVDGDGASEILVVSGDGYMYGIAGVG